MRNLITIQSIRVLKTEDKLLRQYACVGNKTLAMFET